MIESVNVTQQEVPIGSNVLFSLDTLKTKGFNCCNGFEHISNSGLFTISKPGIYEILFKANVTSATAGDTLSFAISLNGEAIPATVVDSTVATAEDNIGITTFTLVRICVNSSKTISIRNVSEVNTTPALVEDALIIVKKIA